MKGHILRYGQDDRDHLAYFLKKFYAKNGSDAVVDEKMKPETLGRNWSCFLYERRGKNFLVLFDGDDGSGATMADCKIVWQRFQNILTHYEVVDYLVFKIQHTPRPEHRVWYPFKTDVYPLGLMTNNPERIFRIADETKPVEQDIDVLFVGGKVHDHNYPYCWPKHRPTIEHWPTNRRHGYAKLLEIKERRKDLNIVTHDGLLDPSEYYKQVNRAKICVDFPGIGCSSRKFYEYMVLGKCVLALRQNNAPWPLEENIHYASMGDDYQYTSMESNINRLLRDHDSIAEIGKAAASLRPLMSHEAVGEYVGNTVDAFCEAYFDGTLENKRVWYK